VAVRRRAEKLEAWHFGHEVTFGDVHGVVVEGRARACGAPKV
jgi:hypothetical protein